MQDVRTKDASILSGLCQYMRWMRNFLRLSMQTCQGYKVPKLEGCNYSFKHGCSSYFSVIVCLYYEKLMMCM